jgi:hypothetical protein
MEHGGGVGVEFEGESIAAAGTLPPTVPITGAVGAEMGSAN